jgi:hypothetical protein
LVTKKIDMRERLAILISSFVPFIIPLIYFSIFAGFRNFEIQYGTQDLIIGYLISTAILFSNKPIYKIYNFFINSKRYLSIILCLIPISLIWGYLYFGVDPVLKNRILFQAIILSLFYLLPLILIILDFIDKNSLIFVRLVYRVFFTFILIYIIQKGSTESLNLHNWGVRLPSVYETFFIFFVSISLLFIFFNREKIFCYDPKYETILIFSLIPLVFYLIHVQIFVGVFYFASITLNPIISYGILRLFKESTNLKKVLIILFFISLLFYPFFLLNKPSADSPLSQKNLGIISQDILQIDPYGKYILTTAPIFAIETNKSLILDNSRLTIYSNDPNNLGSPSYIGLSRNTPSIEDFLINLKEENPSLVVLDNRMRVVLKSQPLLEQYLTNNYAFYKQYDNNVELWLNVGEQVLNSSI